jgi:hypothetical protein
MRQQRSWEGLRQQQNTSEATVYAGRELGWQSMNIVETPKEI